MKLILTLCIAIVCPLIINAQTGPAGVGNSTSNCLWLKADAGTSTTTSGAALSTWSDQSGNGNSVSQATANLRPLYISNLINGYPAIQFDNVTGTNDKLIGSDSPTLDNTSGYTFFTVSRPQTVDGAARVIVSKRTTVSVDQSFMLFYYTGNKFHTDIQTVNDRFASSSTYAANNNYLIDMIYDGSLASASRCKLYNGESLDVTASETSAAVPDNTSPLILGSTDASDNRPFGGYISEVIIFRTALTAAPRIIVNNYLSAKYNIALSANDKYAGDNAANGDYDRDVAGVGKESTGANTSFDPSVNAGLMLNVTSGLDNGDYILSGHNVINNSIITTDVTGMTGTSNARWSRTWYLDVTNTSTSIGADFEFDFSDAGVGGTPGTVSDYVLLYRAGLSGAWTELAVASSTPGDRVKFNGYSVINDGYYTIGTRNLLTAPLPVELLSFDAKPSGNKVDLSWTTASEHNNDFFSVERTSDAVTFDIVCELESNHNTSTISEYNCEDLSPLTGLSYYRLKQTDYDGSSTYSGLVAVNRELPEEYQIYPNPAAGKHFQVGYPGNTFRTGTEKGILDIDVQSLASGLYLLQLNTGAGGESIKVLIP
jgi:hypothetical protein